MLLLISYSSIYSTPFGSYRQLLTRGPISDRTCGRWRLRRAGLWCSVSPDVTWWSNADRAASSRSATYTPTSRPPPAARPRITISASSALAPRSGCVSASVCCSFGRVLCVSVGLRGGGGRADGRLLVSRGRFWTGGRVQRALLVQRVKVADETLTADCCKWNFVC